MATIEELQAADLLALALEKESLLLTGRLFSIFKSADSSNMTQKILEQTLHTELSESVGRLWNPQINFLRKSLDIPIGEPITVKPMRWPELYEQNASIAQKVLKQKSFEALTEAGSTLNTLIARQVDDTQEFVGNLESYSWRRHTDPKACPWCLEQVAQYEQTGWWYRHNNCRCFKVRSDR